MKVGTVVEGLVKRLGKGKWVKARLLQLSGGNMQDVRTKKYYPEGQWKAEGVKLHSDERWFKGECLLLGEEMFRFGGYDKDGMVIMLGLVLEKLGRVVQPDQVKRPWGGK